ncbi:ATP-binding cassette domain-containing protein, partial [Bifidobacterium sp. UBA4282]|uniref:ATP-binding cassette domain-containing protein n=1 Tax=Bifidobacterium sp. UBA4282 TaxID=1946096 RepID=UPI0025C73616
MSMTNDVVLQGSHIDKWFGRRSERRQVLFDVSIAVHAGECLAVIGGSGSGKSTLTRILLGLETADAGTVAYEGADVTGGSHASGYQALRRGS